MKKTVKASPSSAYANTTKTKSSNHMTERPIRHIDQWLTYNPNASPVQETQITTTNSSKWPASPTLHRPFVMITTSTTELRYWIDCSNSCNSYMEYLMRKVVGKRMNCYYKLRGKWVKLIGKDISSKKWIRLDMVVVRSWKYPQEMSHLWLKDMQLETSPPLRKSVAKTHPNHPNNPESSIRVNSQAKCSTKLEIDSTIKNWNVR